MLIIFCIIHLTEERSEGCKSIFCIWIVTEYDKMVKYMYHIHVIWELISLLVSSLLLITIAGKSFVKDNNKTQT